ncbi:MAG: hydantoinase/oxoprolinase family protein [Mesorhizobium sp.]|uniref:hydantoinase/oxoprolinase family protein n=1 Tax=Mesorhizobium sp. TaxID=1871066 RepID=UPI000FE5B6A1|nr:hydantoinase/oxoprolinase family protein [Mesorhizobium sp.]RWJ39824.1 MAG: hydantoinase/oxoprolinase family protein [Mesorhizobium sp.]RWJ81449.1 MAG: hydantoinase/oxoprolinase family protein [Mesorhizobium sp.]TIR08835.1 MAG: hydantoinase/oxoprolinase family protein [Mesorhizobium sp.]
MIRVGIDVGGTFTDFVLINTVSGEVMYFKEASTPHDPSEAIERGLASALSKFDLKAEDIAFVGHGTTVGTNMVIEHRGAKTGQITTKGFRDVLEIGRQVRPDVYDYHVIKPTPLARRQYRIEVSERVDARGRLLVELDEAELRRGVEYLARERVEAVSICFLHSYLYPEHEIRAESIVRELMPSAFVSRSSDVLPEFREYERFSTTTANAYLGPKFENYLARLVERLTKLGISAKPYTVHSNGGLLSIDTVRRYPVRTCLSGPAAGVIGSAAIAAQAGYKNAITFDVGGTSTDVSLITDGTAHFTTSREVASYPIKTPMVDIHVIGAGGGSVAYIDNAGALHVGPRSAGAVPGPVAYMRGGVEPTLTDANVVLGRLNPVAILNGSMPIDLDGARKVVEEKIAKPLGMSVEQAAYGIIRIAVSNMARAIRSVTTQRGVDPRQYAFIAYGGAGPLHGVETAIECGLSRVVAPTEPGTMCARGILVSNTSLDFVQSKIRPFLRECWSSITAEMEVLRGEAERWLASEDVPESKRQYENVLEARYFGQNHEVQVPLPHPLPDAETFLREFEHAHRNEYGYSLPDRQIELVNFRVRGSAEPSGKTCNPRQSVGALETAVVGRRDFFVDPDVKWVDAAVYARDRIPVSARIVGPAIVEDMSSTCVIFPNQSAFVDSAGNLIIELNNGGGE